jgi:trk system potassium uptake protein TrkA
MEAMKIVIVGAGDVGACLAQVLSDIGHSVTVVERTGPVADRLDEELDVRVIRGNGASASVLHSAGAGDADFILPMTSDDQTNLIASSLSKAMGAKSVVTRIHDQTYVDNAIVNYQVHFGIDHLINPEGLCALELAKSIRNPARVAVENLARGQVEAQRIHVAEDSKLVGRSLLELKLHPEVRVGYIRDGESQDVPSADTVISPGATVTVFGPPAELYKLRCKLDPDSASTITRVVIMGGGEIAVALLRVLTDNRFKIRVIERDAERCAHLADTFPDVTIINGDATSLRLLEEEQIENADFFVSTTKDDEHNIMAGIQASKLGAKHVQAVLNKPDYEEMLHHMKPALGLETIVAPRVVSTNEVLRYLSRDPYIELFKFPGQKARIIEITVSAGAPAAGKTLLEVAFPPKTVAVALFHKYQVKVPGRDDRILGGDRIVFITREENINGLLRLLRSD